MGCNAKSYTNMNAFVGIVFSESFKVEKWSEVRDSRTTLFSSYFSAVHSKFMETSVYIHYRSTSKLFNLRMLAKTKTFTFLIRELL